LKAGKIEYIYQPGIEIFQKKGAAENFSEASADWTEFYLFPSLLRIVDNRNGNSPLYHNLCLATVLDTAGTNDPERYYGFF
jgi:hypothetical protein